MINQDRLRRDVYSLATEICEKGDVSPGLESVASEVMDELRAKAMWKKDLFWLLHFISVELVLRYRVWRTVSDSRNTRTEEFLTSIQQKVERFVWSRVVLDDGTWVIEHNSLSNEESTVVDHCFGSSCVLVSAPANHLRWKQEYEEAIKKLFRIGRPDNLWSPLILVSVHFASLYLELYFRQKIDSLLRIGGGETVSCCDAESGFLQIEPKVHVLLLIELWRKHIGSPRGADGLPIISSLREGKSISVRLQSELFLESA